MYPNFPKIMNQAGHKRGCLKISLLHHLYESNLFIGKIIGGKRLG